jgi:hypothetical protein
MPRKEYDYLPKDLECVRGHHFTEEVLHKLHYVSNLDAPVKATIPHGALDNVRCPVKGCGAPVKEPTS